MTGYGRPPKPCQQSLDRLSDFSPRPPPLLAQLPRVWHGARSSRPVCRRELVGGFDSRPPPLLKVPSDQRLCAEAGVR